MTAVGKLLRVGEPAPWFVVAGTTNPRFSFDTVAGRHIVLSFARTAGDESSRAVLDGFCRRRDLFDDQRASFFGVSIDPEDRARARVSDQVPGVRFFWDFDLNVSRMYGTTSSEAGAEVSVDYRRVSYVLDERLRVAAVLPFEHCDTHVDRVLDALESLTPVPAAGHAPVLIVPRILEPQLCEDLIRYYERLGGEDSGFMRDVDGRTVHVLDYKHKRRRDQEIEDQDLRNQAMYRVHDRLVPEIAKAFQFHVTRIERHIIACYDAGEAGHFRPHRDNTTKGTAHRRFAVSLNLNTGRYQGGKLRFPEFGRGLYEAPAGGAVVFSCSLLHEATPVTEGRRYAYLPFLYDDAAAAIRQQNLQFLAPQTPHTRPETM